MILKSDNIEEINNKNDDFMLQEIDSDLVNEDDIKTLDIDVNIESEEDSEYKPLILEVVNNRSNAKEMLIRMKDYSTQINKLMPDPKNFRNKYAIESCMKIISEIMSTELSIIKFLDDSVKTEFDLRRKAKGEDSQSNISIDLLAEAVERVDKKMRKRRG